VGLTKLNDDQLAHLYHEAYKAIDAQEKALKESAPYVTAKTVIAEVEQILTQRLHDTGASSIVTPHGTIHTVSRTTARIMDPEAFRGYVTSNQRWDMLDWKANMTACRAQMQETKEPVPGVELSTFRDLRITTPKTLKGKDNVE
jgi:hypothetical protein